jgi:hypothetical protein
MESGLHRKKKEEKDGKWFTSKNKKKEKDGKCLFCFRQYL